MKKRLNIIKQANHLWYKDIGGKKNKLEIHFTVLNANIILSKNLLIKLYSGKDGIKFTECKDQNILIGDLEKPKKDGNIYIYNFRITVTSKCHNNELYRIKIEFVDNKLGKTYFEFSNKIRVKSKIKRKNEEIESDEHECSICKVNKISRYVTNLKKRMIQLEDENKNLRKRVKILEENDRDDLSYNFKSETFYIEDEFKDFNNFLDEKIGKEYIREIGVDDMSYISDYPLK